MTRFSTYSQRSGTQLLHVSNIKSPFLLPSGTLSDEDKSKHTLSSCKACYHEHQRLQELFPAKPVFVLPIVTLPDQHDTSRKAEKQLAKRLLTEIDMQWEDRYEHSFIDMLPQNVPDTNLTKKKQKERERRKSGLEKEN